MRRRSPRQPLVSPVTTGQLGNKHPSRSSLANFRRSAIFYSPFGTRQALRDVPIREPGIPATVPRFPRRSSRSGEFNGCHGENAHVSRVVLLSAVSVGRLWNAAGCPEPGLTPYLSISIILFTGSVGKYARDFTAPDILSTACRRLHNCCHICLSSVLWGSYTPSHDCLTIGRRSAIVALTLGVDKKRGGDADRLSESSSTRAEKPFTRHSMTIRRSN